MKAKVTKAFPGRPDHEAATRTIHQNEVIEGELAEVAVAQKWAKKVPDNTKVTRPRKKTGN